jgi:signal transduction histidine kinase
MLKVATPQVPEKIAVKNYPHFWQFRPIGRTVEPSMRRTGPAAAVLPLSPLDATIPQLADATIPQLSPRALPHGRIVTFLAVLVVVAATVIAEVALLQGRVAILALAICAAALAAGASRAVSASRQRAITTAVVQERHRIARDLHDGLAQELAYIRMEAMRLAARRTDERAIRIAAAAGRALEESREAITALRSDSDDSFSVELSQVAGDLAERCGAHLTLQVEPGLDHIHPERREALVRIAREAITNGVRHGQATEVALELTGGNGLRMAVRDNGAGFTPGGPRRRGSFGITTMRERAHALGGDLIVRSDPGEGTLVEVVLP